MTVARQGREPGLKLRRDGRDFPMIEWASELIDSMQGICEMLDYTETSRPYAAALEHQRAKIDDVERTPSARMLAEMRQEHESFFEFARRMSKVHKDYFLGLYPPNEQRLNAFSAAAANSHEAQRDIERSDKVDFDKYLAEYFAR